MEIRSIEAKDEVTYISLYGSTTRKVTEGFQYQLNTGPQVSEKNPQDFWSTRISNEEVTKYGEIWQNGPRKMMDTYMACLGEMMAVEERNGRLVYGPPD